MIGRATLQLRERAPVKQHIEDTSRAYFPTKGTQWSEVKQQLAAFKDRDIGQNQGRLNVYCHQGTPELQTIRDEAYTMFSHGNAMLGGFMEGSGTMEAEVLRMALEILNGAENGVGFITTGGTESIFCAMHAAREWALVNRPVRGKPEIITPYSAHAAFDKACHFLGMNIVRVALRDDLYADVAAMEAAVTENTIAIMGSAPCWPYGLIDPITEIAAVAMRHNLWMHVDACVGGYINPWLERLGYDIPTFDFRVPGVRSMSADLHKHGYAAKPCSTVLYSSKDAETYHYVPVDNWPIGEYRTAGMVGSRPAGSIATAWAVMNVLGEEGYIEMARQCMAVKERLVEGIEKIEDLKCLKNDSTMIYFRSETLDMMTIMGGLSERGYFPFGVFNPPMLQLVPEPTSDEVIDDYLRTLAEVVSGVKDGTITSTALARYT
jgi:glutamate/tyrosine decarboxylase-like PLP-dependent enzyme